MKKEHNLETSTEQKLITHSVKIDVKFLFNEREKSLFAFFPKEIFDTNGNKCSYSKIGQHSACSEEYANESRRANFHEYKDLYIELRSIGYNMNVQF